MLTPIALRAASTPPPNLSAAAPHAIVASDPRHTAATADATDAPDAPPHVSPAALGLAALIAAAFVGRRRRSD